MRVRLAEELAELNRELHTQDLLEGDGNRRGRQRWRSSASLAVRLSKRTRSPDPWEEADGRLDGLAAALRPFKLKKELQKTVEKNDDDDGEDSNPAQERLIRARWRSSATLAAEVGEGKFYIVGSDPSDPRGLGYRRSPNNDDRASTGVESGVVFQAMAEVGEGEGHWLQNKTNGLWLPGTLCEETDRPKTTEERREEWSELAKKKKESVTAQKKESSLRARKRAQARLPWVKAARGLIREWFDCVDRDGDGKAGRLQARSIIRALQEFQRTSALPTDPDAEPEPEPEPGVEPGAEPEAAATMAAMEEEAEDDEAKFEALFAELDADNSGEISEEELADWLLQLGDPQNDDLQAFEARVLAPLQLLQADRWYEPAELLKMAQAKQAELERQGALLDASAAAAEKGRAEASATLARARTASDAATAEAEAAVDVLERTVNFQSDEADTPLHIAASHGRVALVEMLLASRANLALPSRWKPGRRPLHATAIGGHHAAAESLLRAGADLAVEDGAGLTPASFAEAGGHWGLLGRFREIELRTRFRVAAESQRSVSAAAEN